jgi:hypothetical protein
VEERRHGDPHHLFRRRTGGGRQRFPLQRPDSSTVGPIWILLLCSLDRLCPPLSCFLSSLCLGSCLSSRFPHSLAISFVLQISFSSSL